MNLIRSRAQHPSFKNLSSSGPSQKFLHNKKESDMMLTVKPAPVTVLNVPIPREDILEVIVVVRTKTGVEVAGQLEQVDVCMNLLFDGVTRLKEQIQTQAPR